MPLEPGLYQVSVYLVMPDPDLPSRRIALDGWSWLTDDGLQLEVTGSPAQSLKLPAEWRVSRRQQAFA
jgi:hypothetical protein